MKIPLEGSSFTLDVSGIAGFFGGEEAFAAMSSVHLVRGRRWLGWYNSPGSYFVAKKYGVLARSRFWDGLYPGANVEPSIMLGLDGKTGPRYVAAHSGTRLSTTGHLANLFAACCDELKVDEVKTNEVIAKEVMANATSSGVSLTVAYLDDFKEFKGYPGISENLSPFDSIAIIPIGYSICASVMCAVFGDWYCFAMILLGIVCNGISCFVIGSGMLQVKHPKPSPHSPPGDGVLVGGPRVIVLKGSETSVNTITKGKYYLEYASQPRYHDIGLSSVALTIQFLLQLFLVPQGQLFGQIMFLSSLGVSWVFNAYLASVDNELLQQKILTKVLQNPKTRTLQFPKWTALVAFAAIYLQAKDARSFLNEMIPNDTTVWRIVKENVVKTIQTGQDGQDPKTLLSQSPEKLEGLDTDEVSLLNEMIDLASIGYLAAKAERDRRSTCHSESAIDRQVPSSTISSSSLV